MSMDTLHVVISTTFDLLDIAEIRSKSWQVNLKDSEPPGLSRRIAEPKLCNDRAPLV